MSMDWLKNFCERRTDTERQRRQERYIVREGEKVRDGDTRKNKGKKESVEALKK